MNTGQDSLSFSLLTNAAQQLFHVHAGQDSLSFSVLATPAQLWLCHVHPRHQGSLPFLFVRPLLHHGCVMCMQDRIASLNGRTVQLVIRQDRPAFIRLIGISVLQSAASAVLAPSLRHVADALAMTWRRRLTAAAHSRYFRGNTFYTTSQLAGSCPFSPFLAIFLLRLFVAPSLVQTWEAPLVASLCARCRQSWPFSL